MAEAKTKPAAQKAAPAAKPAATKKSSAAASAPKPPAAENPGVKKTATTKAATAKKPAAKKAAVWNPGNEERYNMIQVAAYYLAERDGFSGNPVEYWTAAELQIRTMLPKK